MFVTKLQKNSFSKLKVMISICMMLIMTGAAFAQYNAFDDPPTPGGAGGNSVSEFGPVKAEIEGGDLQQGQTAQVIVMIRNSSTTPIAIKMLDLVPSSNVTATIGSNQCGTEPVKPGIECAVTVSVKAEGSGKYRVGMLINHTGRSQITNAAIVGTISGGDNAGGQPANEIEAFPNLVDFGKSKGRTPLVRSVALRNASTKPVTLSGLELMASPLTGFSVSAPNCKQLQPAQACVATVTWTPQVEGKAEGVLVMRHDGPSGSLQVSLSGEYEVTKTAKAERFPSPVPGEGLIIADRDEVSFGTELDGAASITVSLVNSGEKEVTLKQVKLAGSDNGLSLSPDDCRSGRVLQANEGCALTINWVPRREGPVIDDVQIIHTGARGVLILPVRGTAKKTVTLNLPVLSSNIMPKLSKDMLNENVLGIGPGPGSTAADNRQLPLSSDVAALNGYRVTSLGAIRAVISGPRGRILVEDGKTQAIAGGQWIPQIIPEGVKLIGKDDTVFLMFDRALATGGGMVSAPTVSSVAVSADNSTEAK